MQNTSTFLATLVDLLISGGLIGIMVFVWKAASWATRIEDAVKMIATNHLTHIYERLGAIEEELKNGRNQDGDTRRDSGNSNRE